MPKVEVSVGELIDKITILEIKQERIEDEVKLVHINTEQNKQMYGIFGKGAEVL